MSETFDVTIDSIAAGGDGVGRHNGMVVFVPRTAPGDVARVEARPDGRLMRGRLIKLLTASTKRAEPACRHYVADSCGGCQLQHLEYDAQLDAKAGIIADSLTRIGRLNVERPVVEASGARWRYRRKLTLAFRRSNGAWIAGLHRLNSPDSVFPLEDCEITDAAVMNFARLVVAQGELLPADRDLRVSVRSLASGFSVVVEGGTTWRNHRSLFDAIPSITELWWQPREKRRELVQSRASSAAGASFTQVNEGVAASLVRHVSQLAEKVPHATAIDAYAGTGDIAVALAAIGARVTAIEIDREASNVCASRLPAGSRVLNAPVERALSGALPVDLVVLNPPRAGLDESVTSLLQTPRTQNPAPRTLIYVSCNPATLARDLKRMDRFRVTSIRGFDMFPQTSHVETVVALEPAA
ncbi:MAG TPA: TRAM domain-containing protein [Gemmatimonadaceae bacterium]